MPASMCCSCHEVWFERPECAGMRWHAPTRYPSPKLTPFPLRLPRRWRGTWMQVCGCCGSVRSGLALDGLLWTGAQVCSDTLTHALCAASPAPPSVQSSRCLPRTGAGLQQLGKARHACRPLAAQTLCCLHSQHWTQQPAISPFPLPPAASPTSTCRGSACSSTRPRAPALPSKPRTASACCSPTRIASAITRRRVLAGLGAEGRMAGGRMVRCLPAGPQLLLARLQPRPAAVPPTHLALLQVQLKKRGDDERYLAKVLSIGTECDLALLTGGWAWVGCSTSRSIGGVPLTLDRWLGPLGPPASVPICSLCADCLPAYICCRHPQLMASTRPSHAAQWKTTSFGRTLCRWS